MKSKAAAHIRFYGTDYTEVGRYIHETKIECGDPEVREIVERELEDILYAFLDKNNGRASSLPGYDDGDGRASSLYRWFGGARRFHGTAGVVAGKLQWASGERSLPLDITLEIHSRFDADTKNNKIGRPYFLSVMLQQLPPVYCNEMVSENPDEELFDFLLVFKYARCLREALIKGCYRTYHRFENNDGRPKGAIDISRHIRLNMGLDNGKIAYSLRERSTNNYLNHLIVAAYEYIKARYPAIYDIALGSDVSLRETVQRLSCEIGYPLYSVQKLIDKNLTPVSHPYYSEYEQLRAVSLKILRHEGVSVFDGAEDETEGILYHIPTLWEKFMEYYLKRSDKYIAEAQFGVKIFDFSGSGIFRHETAPDYVFFTREDKTPFMIIDAKFKPAWAELIKNDEWYSDWLSADYDKCMRDMVSLKARAAGILCPSAYEIPGEKCLSHSISRYNSDNVFYTFGVYVPPTSDGKTFDEWKTEFNEHLERAVGIIEKEAEKQLKIFIKSRD